MHLPDRGGRHRQLVELEEEPADRLLQILGDHPLDIGERERRHVVLEAPQLDDDVLRDDVGSCGEELPELDERRPELVEHLAEMASADGVDLGGSATAFEQRPEAVLHRDLGDLAQPPDVRRLRAWTPSGASVARRLARECCRHAPVDGEHRPRRRPGAVGDEERNRLGDVGAGDGTAEQAARRIERLDLARAGRRGPRRARGGDRPTRASSPRRSRRGSPHSSGSRAGRPRAPRSASAGRGLPWRPSTVRSRRPGRTRSSRRRRPGCRRSPAPAATRARAS